MIFAATTLLLRPLILAFMAAWLLVLQSDCYVCAAAFVPSRSRSYRASTCVCHGRPKALTSMWLKPDDESSFDTNGVARGEVTDANMKVTNDSGLDIVRGSDSDISDGTWDEIEGGAPNQWMVMKNLLGINIFTYILGVFIIIFLSMNAFYGPGWLGQSLGWEGVGTFTKVSDSLPLNVDVSRPDYLL
ncbi:hypothetical protein ACHAWF_013479 [Thalassiosira exigua]